MSHHEVTVPEGDLFVFAGDACNAGKLNELADFADWARLLPHSSKVFVPGNHDWPLHPGRQEADAARRLLTQAGFEVLIDEGREIGGLTLYGMPWSPRFYDWAFTLGRHSTEMLRAVGRIPKNLDVLITHGPPFGTLDLNGEGRHTGCENLLDRIASARPRLHVFGHIHNSYGLHENRRNGVVSANASALDGAGLAVNPPLVVDVTTRVVAPQL